MQVKFLGAAGTVTGSKYLISTSETKILVDCGLFQGLKELRLRNWQPLPFKAEELDAIVLTHAHIDHSGIVPLLVRSGFRSPIFATRPTVDLCELLLADCGRIHEEDAEYANRKGFSKHHPALPLYTELDAQNAMKYFKPTDAETWIEIGDLRIRFESTGHILGACHVLVEHRGVVILFSGDIGRYQDLLEEPPKFTGGADYIIMESTYGNRCHSAESPTEVLAAAVKKVVKRRGTVLIPSFAVGRAQTLMYALRQAMDQKLCPEVPIYLNSPLATKVTRLYEQYVNWHRLSNEECQRICGSIHFVNSVEESKALNRSEEPKVIISASGMLTGGRILHHLKYYGPDERNLIMLAGFQAAGTRGAALTQGSNQLKIHGRYVPIHAEISQMDVLSAHADQRELLQWLSSQEQLPKRVFLTHGELEAADEMRRRITENNMVPVNIPKYGDEFEFI